MELTGPVVDRHVLVDSEAEAASDTPDSPRAAMISLGRDEAASAMVATRSTSTPGTQLDGAVAVPLGGRLEGDGQHTQRGEAEQSPPLEPDDGTGPTGAVTG